MRAKLPTNNRPDPFDKLIQANPFDEKGRHVTSHRDPGPIVRKESSFDNIQVFPLRRAEQTVPKKNLFRGEKMDINFDMTNINTKVDNFKRLKDAGITGTAFEAGRRELAEMYKAITLKTKELETLGAPLEGILKASGLFVEFFPDLIKVVLQEGAENTEIDDLVLNDLTFAEMREMIKVTEVGLRSIGREDLITKHKKHLGTRKAPSLLVKDVTKAEKSALLEGRDPKAL